MTGPREWRHAESCKLRYYDSSSGCSCGLSAVRDALAAGHRVVVGPDGEEGRLELTGWYDGLAHIRFNALAAVRELVDLASPVDPEEG